jgi:DNA adenine methylase
LPNHSASQLPPESLSESDYHRFDPRPGSMSLHLKWLLPLLPECTHYVEPFGRSALVLLNRSVSPDETYNDLDGEVVNFRKVVLERPKELQRRIDQTTYSRAESKTWLKPDEDLPDLFRAQCFYESFAVNAIPPNWETTPNHGSNGMALGPIRFKSGATGFNAVASRLSGVKLESRRPAEKVIAALDGPNTLFYCDPPHMAKRWLLRGPGVYRPMNGDEQRDFARLLRDCRAKVAINGYDTLHNNLFPAVHWRKLLAPPKRNCASEPLPQEVLWCNYGEDGERLRPTMVRGGRIGKSNTR